MMEKKTHHAVYTANQTKKVHIICIDNTPVREAPSIDIDTKKKEENEATKKHTHTLLKEHEIDLEAYSLWRHSLIEET